MENLTTDSPLKDILASLGIEMFRKDHEWYLSHKGKTIVRPGHLNCWRTVKQQFDIDCPLLKIKGYYQEEDSVSLK